MGWQRETRTQATPKQMAPPMQLTRETMSRSETAKHLASGWELAKAE